MENQAGFREALGDLLAIADASSRRISAEQIRSFFSEWDLSEEQWELVYSYLELNQIAVEGHQADADRLSYLKGEHVQEQETEGEQAAGGLDGEDSRCYAMYLEDLEHIKEIEPGELEMLLASFAAGDQRAKGRLAEIHLKRVVELAREYAGRGVLIGDLIQEGNMALLSAMETFSGGDFGVYITREICSAMDAAVAEQTGQADTGSYLAAQANAMMKATEELVEELGREATLSEVARKMHLSEDMTRDIMKISMDALSVVEANGSGEVFGENTDFPDSGLPEDPEI
ncbi:MAG TPA: hypothetical protein H9672_09955 [Firmicutes bacterium]|nr:hypothetical protein [Bacillota bacterium]